MRHECSLCHRTFCRRNVLRNHVETVHMKLEQYHCPCGKKFRSSGAHFAHTRKCTSANQKKKTEEKKISKQASQDGETVLQISEEMPDLGNQPSSSSEFNHVNNNKNSNGH